MKTASILRILFVAALSLFLIEALARTSDQWAIVETPILLAVWFVIILFMVAIEVSVASIQQMLFETLNEEAKERYLAKEAESKNTGTKWLNKTYRLLVGEKKARSEEEIIIDHDYDGIRELDNNLPTWWVYGFYATIIFAAVYLVRFHVFDGVTQDEEYRIEVATAQVEIEEYRKTAKGLVDASTVVMLTDEADLSSGKNVFDSNCAVCHRADGGGGIGPNLTDKHWILGGSLSNIYEVISEGGRPGKGMISWKNDLKPLQIAQVSSYVMTMQNTNPPDGKEAEGELFEQEEIAEEIETAEEKIDQPEFTEDELESDLEID
ncbi:MAG: cbb3-type cytochrome c oxidase N-terminal domain-containing protein [Flavobacteriaceae bacterium]